MRRIGPSSPEINRITTKKPKYDFPWNDLDIGFSFGVAYTEIKFSSLRGMASERGKSLNKTFRVIDHGEKDGYEVGRIADPVHVPEIPLPNGMAYFSNEANEFRKQWMAANPASVGTNPSSAENNAQALSLEVPSPKPAVEIASWLQPQNKE